MRFRLFILIPMLVLAGCAIQPVGKELEEKMELTSVPFFPQRDYQCGPASLATVLRVSGVAVTPDELTGKVYIPGRKGSLQIEMVAAARGYDRLAYEIEAAMEALVAQVGAGRPVLVLQNLGLKRMPVWHYAVVIGFEPEGQRVILRSGTEERLAMPARKFVRSWSLADQWAVVLLKPEEMPADADARRYVQAASGLEAAGRQPAALRAYRTALTRWPDDATALLGVGNVLYAQRDLPGAEAAYRTLVGKHPRDAIARNNLAQVLLERGQPRAALREIQAARALPVDERFVATLRQTETEILEALR